MRRIIVLLLCLPVIIIHAQVIQPTGVNAELPQVVPASPEVSAIMKGAELSANMHTGAAATSIPVFEIKLKDFSLPISLNYSSNGTKLEEIPSRVGLGWSLNVGGMINKIVKGKPDEESTIPTTILSESDLLQQDQTALTYMNNLGSATSPLDVQPDEFRFSVGGLSGKFYILRDGTVLQTSFSNLKIIANQSSGKVGMITVIDEKGIIYRFGEADKFEETLNYTQQGKFISKTPIRTGWFLTSITLPGNEIISFDYSTVSPYTKTGITHTVRKDLLTSNMNHADCHGSNGTLSHSFQCPSLNDYSETINYVTYRSYYLTNISTTAGTFVSFLYENRPDNSNDKRLKDVVISNSITNISFKRMTLFYSNTSSDISSDNINQRFFLEKVRFSNPNNTNDVQDYTLSYIDKELLPNRMSYSVDHLGFYNGAYNNNLLPYRASSIPNPFTNQTLEYPSMFDAWATANRNPNGFYAMKGMLSKIEFPTGGYQEFVYEPNKKEYWADVLKVEQPITAHLEGAGAPPESVYNTTFMVYKNQTAEMFASSYWVGSGSPPVGSSGGNASNASKIAHITLYDDASGATIATWMIEGYTGYAGYSLGGNNGSNLVTLVAGTTYRFELRVKNSSNNFAKADLVYDASNANIYEWKLISEELCGIRVKQVNSFDPVTNNTLRKYYHYRSLLDTTTASAQVLYQYSYISHFQTGTFFICGTLSRVIYCDSKTLSSNSSIPLYESGNIPVSYKYVLETDHPNYINGCIEHNFLTTTGVYARAVMGYPVPMVAHEPFDDMNGKELGTKFYNSDRQLLKHVFNSYSTDPRVTRTQSDNFNVRVRYDGFYVNPLTPDCFKHLDVSTYDISEHWHHLDYTTTTEYDLVTNTSMVTQVNYEYNPTATVVLNTNPSKIITTKSNGDILSVTKSYPTDYPTSAIMLKLKSKNMKGLPVEEATYNGTDLLFKSTIEYFDWFNDQTILKPKYIYKQKSASGILENRLTFSNYDTKGNLLSLNKTNDVKIGYIYDYNNQLPIAECSNLPSITNFAYTSFEANGKGHWDFSGIPIADNSSPTGLKAYDLYSGGNSFDIHYAEPLAANTNYVVYCYAKTNASNQPVNVLIDGTVATKLVTKNGWILNKYTFNSGNRDFVNNPLIVSGQARIDELKLYPLNAVLKTYSFLPDIGVISTCDENNIYLKYEYDGFNRLRIIRDWDNNILKKYTYNYKETTPACSNTAPSWQQTGNLRCQKNSVVNNANTGNQEREEIDINTWSPSYQHKRWVNTGSNSACPIQVCTGIGKRWVNGVCETGFKVYVETKYIGNLQWECKYHYQWSDGYSDPLIYSVIQNQPCNLLSILLD